MAVFSFAWTSPIGDNEDLVPGGADLGDGNDFTVTGIEGYFEFPPAVSLTIRLMDGLADGAPENVVVTGSYFAAFGLSKTVATANRLRVILSGGPDGAEGLQWARVIATVP